MNNTELRKAKEDIVVFHNKNQIPYIKTPHLHSSYEIYYNISGARGFMVGGKVYKCKGNDLILIPMAETHKAVVNKNVPYERCIINIPVYVADSVEKFCENDALLWLKGGTKKANLNENQHKKLMELTENYNKEGDMKKFSKFVEIMVFLKEIFSEQYREELLEDGNISYVDKALLEIEKNFKDIGASGVAEALFINEDYINRLFKDETGMTLKNYIITRRIAEAKKHLYFGKSVKEACVLSGFNNYSNFIRTFKNYEGYPPGKLEKLTDAM